MVYEARDTAGNTVEIELVVHITDVEEYVRQPNPAPDIITAIHDKTDVTGTSGDDILTTGDDASVVAGGGGDDAIILGDGADIVLYRFASDDEGWYGLDGSDTITDFTLGEDQFVLVDTDCTAASLADVAREVAFGEAEGFSLNAILNDAESHVIGVRLRMPQQGDGTAGDSGSDTVTFPLG